MKKIIQGSSALLACLAFTACSSLKKTLVYSALSGGAVGAIAGKSLSPNKESERGNAAIFGAAGAVVSAVTAYFLYQEDPENKELKQMILNDKREEVVEIINSGGDFSGGVYLNVNPVKKYVVPTQKNLPPEVRRFVGKKIVIEHIVPEKYVKLKDKSVYIPEFKTFEVVDEK